MKINNYQIKSLLIGVLTSVIASIIILCITQIDMESFNLNNELISGLSILLGSILAVIIYSLIKMSIVKGNIRRNKIISSYFDMAALGFKSIYDDNYHSIIKTMIKDANYEVKILGGTLLHFSNEDFASLIYGKIKKGCKVKLLLLDPNSKFLYDPLIEQDEENLKKKKIDILSAINNFEKLRERSMEFKNEMLQIRYYNSSPSYFVIQTNKGVGVGLNLLTTNYTKPPLIELYNHQSKLSIPFIEHFEILWNTAKKDYNTVANNA